MTALPPSTCEYPLRMIAEPLRLPGHWLLVPGVVMLGVLLSRGRVEVES